jgi:hypothetical protein
VPANALSITGLADTTRSLLHALHSKLARQLSAPASRVQTAADEHQCAATFAFLRTHMRCVVLGAVGAIRTGSTSSSSPAAGTVSASIAGLVGEDASSSLAQTSPTIDRSTSPTATGDEDGGPSGPTDADEVVPLFSDAGIVSLCVYFDLVMEFVHAALTAAQSALTSATSGDVAAIEKLLRGSIIGELLLPFATLLHFFATSVPLCVGMLAPMLSLLRLLDDVVSRLPAVVAAGTEFEVCD